MKISRWVALLLTLVAVAFAAAQKKAASGPTPSGSLAESATSKLDYIDRNGRQPKPNPKPTDLTEQEINAYFDAGKAPLPRGVRNLHLTGDGGTVTGTARVDFDELKEGRTSGNPLLAIFSGVHNVRVSALASGANRRGSVHVQSVEIDGVQIPRMALEYFAGHYLKPKYPNVGLDSTFVMPARIDTAVVGRHVLTIVQK
ncbi:MAG TPA: hypothetical protein VFA60_07950 [Terriglobales bacterium]|nr:hypothetical protein [Terriglobales bacterium]